MIKNFLKDERGSAMTEFVIGLPIFILIFTGMGSIYQIGNAGVKSMATANYELWKASQDSLRTSLSVSPAAALTTGSLIDATQGAGIYGDSYIKTIAFSQIGLAQNVAPKNNLLEINDRFKESSPSKHLLDDFYRPKRSTGGFTSFLNSLVQTTGSGLGIAAGIRYGGVKGRSSSAVNTSFGTYTADSGKLTLPLNTAATHRLAAVALIRLEHTKDKVTDESILNFNYSPDFDGPPDWGQPSAANPPPQPGGCTGQQTAYAECQAEAATKGSPTYVKWKWYWSRGKYRRKLRNACGHVKPDASCDAVAPTPIDTGPGSCAHYGLPFDCSISIGG